MMMFLFIAGLQPRTVEVDKNPRPCPSCGHPDLILKRRDQYFSLFFIPLIRIKKGRLYLECGRCHVLYGEDGIEVREHAGESPDACPRCPSGVDTDFLFCPYCGRRL